MQFLHSVLTRKFLLSVLQPEQEQTLLSLTQESSSNSKIWNGKKQILNCEFTYLQAGCFFSAYNYVASMPRVNLLAHKLRNLSLTQNCAFLLQLQPD